MVPSTTNTAVTVTGILTVVLPLLAIIIYAAQKKGKRTGSAWLLGGVEFLAVQLIISSPVSAMAMAQFSFVGTFMIALVVACFETVATYFLVRFLERGLCFERSFAAGMGHGTAEAFWKVGLAAVFNSFYIQMINSGEYDKLLEKMTEEGEKTDDLVLLKKTLVSGGMWIHYHALAQQILMFILHMGMTILVCWMFHRMRQKLALVICFCVQFAATFAVQALDAIGGRTSYIMMYLFLAGASVFASAAILYSYRGWTSEAAHEKKTKLVRGQWKERNRKNRVDRKPQEGEPKKEQDGEKK